MNSLILRPLVICAVFIATGVQAESVIFPLFSDRDKRSAIFLLPWQLLTQELQWRFLQ